MNAQSVLTIAVLGAAACSPAPAADEPFAQQAQPATSTMGFSSLKTVPVPRPSNWADFVANDAAAVRLGKALFWDVQTSSDGKVACATCHFQAGSDGRVKNQIRPVGGPFFHRGPNHTLTAADYPFHRLANFDDARSAELEDTPNRTASQGIALHDFVDIVPGRAEERGTLVPDPVFNVGGVNVRRAAAGNAPTVINSVFNYRQLIVGFPQNVFNGVNPLGERDTSASVFLNSQGRVSPVQVRIDNASLASQSVDPPVNSSEMAFRGRTFPKICKKLFTLKPLAGQQVASGDSVLGQAAARGGRGLNLGYRELVQAAFRPQWWNGAQIIRFTSSGPVVSQKTGGALSTDEYTQMEANCSLFWGLAMQAYVSTLVADDSHFDRYLEGRASLTPYQEQGRRIFMGQPSALGGTAHCSQCHLGAELTSQSVRNVRAGKVERMTMVDGESSLIDTGFRNIGVRRFTDLPGLASIVPGFGPLAYVRYAQQGGDIQFELTPALAATERTSAVEAAYKVPGLRNIELTGPYFHNGGLVSLRQVVDFYNRGSDFADYNRRQVDPRMQPLGLSAQERCWLVEFLLTLTDERVRYEQAPFDHPELPLLHGHEGGVDWVQNDGAGRAVDRIEVLPAVGAGGAGPLLPFLAVDPHRGSAPGQGGIGDCGTVP